MRHSGASDAAPRMAAPAELPAAAAEGAGVVPPPRIPTRGSINCLSDADLPHPSPGGQPGSPPSPSARSDSSLLGGRSPPSPTAAPTSSPPMSARKSPGGVPEGWEPHAYVAFALLQFCVWGALWPVMGEFQQLPTERAWPPTLLSNAPELMHPAALYLLIQVVCFYTGDARRHVAPPRGERGAALCSPTGAFVCSHTVTPPLYLLAGKALGRAGAFPMLSAASLGGMEPQGYAVLVTGVLTIVGFAVYHARCALRLRRRGFCRVYFTTFVLMLGAVGAMAAAGALWGGRQFHLHHYMWAGTLACFCVFDTHTSAACQGLLLGIVTEELCSGGVLPFYGNGGNRAQ